MPFVREQSGGTAALNSYYKRAFQTAVTYTANEEQDLIICCRFDWYAGTSTIIAGGNTVYSTTTTPTDLYVSSNIHLSAGETVIANGNSSQYLCIATSGTGTIQ